MNSEISNKVCEICGQKAIVGILLDNYDNNDNQNIIKFSCNDHYLQIYKKIKEESKNKK